MYIKKVERDEILGKRKNKRNKKGKRKLRHPDFQSGHPNSTTGA